MLEQWCRRPLLSVLAMTVLGIVLASCFQAKPIVNAEVVKRSSFMHFLQTIESPVVKQIAQIVETSIGSGLTEAETAALFQVDRFNLVGMYAETKPEQDNFDSYADLGLAFLAGKDSEWFKQIYRGLDRDPAAMCSALRLSKSVVTGRYNPNDAAHQADQPGTWVIHQWNQVNAKFVNGAGQRIAVTSNAKAILSMASVYTYQTGVTDQEALIDYLDKLWTRSHSYQMSVGRVYYCQGCLASDWVRPQMVQAPSWPSDEEVSLASESEALAAAQLEAERWNYNCPGHVDLNVTIVVNGLDEKKGLFYKDKIGADQSAFTDLWQGWSEEMRQYVKTIYEQDWNAEYDMTPPETILLGQPLSAEELQQYLALLPAEIDPRRTEVIRFALDSVGKIPYYWGGKPTSEGYEGNQFGTLTGADYKGRMLRGLDCSGWINWVYWSVFHEPYPYEGTDGFVTSGTPIKKAELLPGDMAVLPGEDSHVVMFLAWADPSHNEMYAIHETGGVTNTVVVGVVHANWPYYRRMIE